MKDLNNYFGGLKDNYPIGFQTGIDYLSNSEIALNLDAVKEVALTIPYNPKDMLRTMDTDLSANSQDACSLKSNSADRDGFAFMDAANQLNGDPEQQNSNQNDETDNGEEGGTVFNEDGEKESTPSGPASDNEMVRSRDGIIQFIAVVAGESSNNHDEAEAIGEVIQRRMDIKKVELSDGFLDEIGGETQYNAIGDDIYNSIVNSTWEKITSPDNPNNERVKGAIHSIVSPQDNISNGAYFWNASNPKTGSNWDSYRNGTFKIAAEIGKSTFFKYADPNKKWP